MKKLLFLLLVCLIVSGETAQAVAKKTWEKNKNELPAYGGLPFTAEEQKQNQLFINGISKAYGSKEIAVDEALHSGWLSLLGGSPRIAMRRFNQGWLLDPASPRIDYGFAMAMLSAENPKEMTQASPKAIDYLSKAAKLDRSAKNLLGVHAERGIGLTQNTERATALYQEADSLGYEGLWKQYRGQIKVELSLIIDGDVRAQGIWGYMTANSLVKRLNSPGSQQFAICHYIRSMQTFGNITNPRDSDEFLTEVKKLPQKMLDNGVWLVLIHSELYSDFDRTALEQLTTLLEAEGIPLYTCYLDDLPDGWSKPGPGPKGTD